MWEDRKKALSILSHCKPTLSPGTLWPIGSATTMKREAIHNAEDVRSNPRTYSALTSNSPGGGRDVSFGRTLLTPWCVLSFVTLFCGGSRPFWLLGAVVRACRTFLWKSEGGVWSLSIISDFRPTSSQCGSRIGSRPADMRSRGK